jgi:Glycosyltransferase family 9 (heptosyltransferase)
MKQRILGLHHCNLGDHIRSMGIATFKGELDGVRHKLSVVDGYQDYSTRLEEIHGLMKGYFLPDLTREPADTPPPSWHTWAAPPMRTAVRWDAHEARLRRTVCYQFDSVSNKATAAMTQAEESQVMQQITSWGLEPIRLGSHISLKQAVDSLSECQLFIGVDSGFSHLAHCVGTPVYLYERGIPTYQCHSLCQYVSFRNPQDLDHMTKHYRDVMGGRYGW